MFKMAASNPDVDVVSLEEETTEELPDRETCEKLVQDFASVTNTDVALAQFFLQDHNWNLEPSLNAYYESRSSEDVNNSSSDPDLLVTFDSANGSLLSSLPLRGNITVKPPSKFTFMTWNVDGLDEHNLKKRTKAVVKIIEMERPDIVFLQEAIPVTYSYLEDHLPHYMFIAGGVENYFIATLLHRTTVYFDGHVLHPFPNSRMGRNLILVDCHIGSLKLRLLNSHLESTQDFSAERKSQLRTALNLLKASSKEHTSIFAGDLNLRDKEVKEVQIPPNVYDLWESCGQRQECKYTWDTQRNSNKSFPGRFKPRARFDRAYLYHGDPPSVLPKHFGLVGIQKVAGTQSFPSDHWGIIVHFDIMNQRARTSSPPPSHSNVKNLSEPCTASSSQNMDETIDCFDVSEGTVDRGKPDGEEMVHLDETETGSRTPRKRNHSLVELD